jgi:hypothetical protein
MNDTGEIKTTNAKLNNLYSVDVFEALKQFYSERKLSLITSGKDLLSQFNQLYPNIVLCGKSIEQLNNGIFFNNIRSG